MRAEDLHHDELLELDPDAGVIRFAGQRALLLDAIAIGLLRKNLVDNFGRTAARAVLTQFGFAHGWRMAEALETQFTWDSKDDWQSAGPQIHSLGGLFLIKPGGKGPLSQEGSTLGTSYEAEQHLLHLGQSDGPVCWTICGLISGYLSCTTDEEIYVLEDRCMGAGYAACHLIGRTREDWGDAHAEELAFFDPSRLKECLDVSLIRVTEALKAAELKIRLHRRVVGDAVPVDIVEPLGIVCRSPKMQRTVDLARRIAKVDATVLVSGESGVGKERIARLLHAESPRAGGPFLAVNCGAITETLLEAELFGHSRGAFTGAASDRAGLFEAANHGTLLLDEIGEISTGMQVKLLRVLQEHEVRRVGENKSRPVDVRIVSATNRNLAESVAAGDFRQDLYYRLKVVELNVPPLRDRREDLLPLARVLLSDAAARMGRDMTSLTSRVADQLLRYRWPGNVRELENAIERAVALAQGDRLAFDDLPEDVRQAPPTADLSSTEVKPLRMIEKDYILTILERNGGNQTRAAKQLQIGTATLYRKLKSYGLIGKT